MKRTTLDVTAPCRFPLELGQASSFCREISMQYIPPDDYTQRGASFVCAFEVDRQPSAVACVDIRQNAVTRNFIVLTPL